MKKILPLLLLLGSLPLFSQTIYYVKPTGSDGNNGTSWATAFRTVQKALATITTGQVWVATGTYFPDEGGGQANDDRGASFTLKNGVALYGGFAGTETALGQRSWIDRPTILSGDIQKDYVATNNSLTVVYAESVNPTAVLDGFTITEGYTEGEYASGAGMNTYKASPTITNCFFKENTATTGAAMSNMAGTPFVTNCRFWNNTAHEGAAMENWDASPRVTNCSFWKNTADRGAAIINVGESTAFIVNCSFCGNTGNEGTIYNMNGGFSNMSNSILWGNTTGIVNYWYQGYAAVSNSIVQGGFEGGTNILDVDPLFADTAYGDLRLRACSPAINAGHPEFIPAGVTTDVRNRPRIALGAVDMGAYEFQPGEDAILYVNASAPAGGDGSSWAHAFARLQDALVKAGSCPGTVQLWVATGTYYPDEGAGRTDNDRAASFVLKNNIALYGGFAGTETGLFMRNPTVHETILSGDIDQVAGAAGNAYHVVQAEQVTATARLDGFTITGGNADGALFYLENCDIGGGIFIYDGTPTITHCSFRSNHAISMGGAVASMYSYDLVLTNCLFYDNSAKWGGAIAHDDYSSSSVINCSFSGNKAEKGGAIFCLNASPVVTNSILWGNTGGQIDARNAFVSYSIVQDGYYSGAGNLSVDPLFVRADTGNLHLQPCSPAIDAGTNAQVTATDLDGEPRTVVVQTDMGAYEFQGTVVYVKKDATGLHNGTSWANAYTSLQDALAQPAGCARLVTIWVARGTYYPDEGAGRINNDRSASFRLVNHISILGGFAGTETALSQRNPFTAQYYRTILSGEIDGVTGNAGNSYHVVRSEGVDSSAVLDGFTITAGNATGSTVPDNGGGGLYNTATPTIRYCTFNANIATQGGAVYNKAAASIINCRFTQNRAATGGAVYNQSASPAILNGWFWKNSATSQGGALYNTAASPRIINGTFNSNTALSGYGGALRNVAASAPVLTNAILWGDIGGEISSAGSTPVVSYSIVQGGYSGEGNLDTDPLFTDAANGDLSLKYYPILSPAIDAGNNAVVTLPTDVFGHQRIYNRIVDRGADEYYPPSKGGPEPLVLTCPPDFTLQSVPGSCGAVADYSGAHAATTTGGEPPITITYDPAPGTLLPLGDVWVTVTAKDAYSTYTCSFWVTVVDTTPPVITDVSVDKPVLYPPNHQLQEVEVNYTATDNCLDVSTTLSVSSNEPVYGTGSGDTGPDWQVIDAHTVRLRAERSGKGSDRVYTITVTAADAAENTATATTMVTVPHDKGAVTVNEAAVGKEVASLEVKAVPNPSADGFTLRVQSPSDLPVTIRVIDATGRVIERKEGVAANGTLYLGSTYKPGVYNLQVQQGGVRQTLKLVKQTH